jgi:hypothetical protein
MENTVNQNPQTLPNEVVHTEQVEMPESQPVDKDVYLDGVEVYKDIMVKIRKKLQPLVEEGSMSEAVANRVMDEFSFDAFKQSVKVNYR